ncbi:MAG: hypothetical protein M3R37_11015 [Actinomycetota bacterium]|nr:hypothetical protein [Actinomycetota bacterium]
MSANLGERPAGKRSVALIILGSVVGLMALAFVSVGGTALWSDLAKRDSAGYYTGSTHRIANGSYAVTHDGVDIQYLPNWANDGKLAKLRIAATSETDRPLFIGVARESDANTYLANVAHANLNDYEESDSKQTYDLVSGTKKPLRPASQGIWVASATGSGPTALKWKVGEGRWTVVLMNADASKGVAADVKLGVNVRYLGWVSAGLLAVGGVLAAAAAYLIVRGSRRKSPQVKQVNSVPAVA